MPLPIHPCRLSVSISLSVTVELVACSLSDGLDIVLQLSTQVTISELFLDDANQEMEDYSLQLLFLHVFLSLISFTEDKRPGFVDFFFDYFFVFCLSTYSLNSNTLLSIFL